MYNFNVGDLALVKSKSYCVPTISVSFTPEGACHFSLDKHIDSDEINQSVVEIYSVYNVYGGVVYLPSHNMYRAMDFSRLIKL